MLRDDIKKLITDVLGEEGQGIQVEHPGDSSHGDFSTNVAMHLARRLKKDPRVFADLLVDRLVSKKKNVFEKIEVDGPGFINFFLEPNVFYKELLTVLSEGDRYGESSLGENKKVNVEFISANPTGELHIGNGRGAFFGDALSNVLDKAGYKVSREYYVQDSKKSTQIQELGKTVLGEGSSYKTPYLEEKIKQYNNVAMKQCRNEAEAGYLVAQEIQKDNKDFLEKKLKIKFDEWVSEESLYEEGRVDKIYKLLKKKKLVYKKEGAEWFKGTALGASQDYVLVRSTGEPTYLLPDLAYHDYKFSRRFSKIIDIWGADHQGHVEKIKAGLKIFNTSTGLSTGKLPEMDFLITQMVRLKREEKLSKRLGRIIALEWLVDEVGLDATRFFYLMKSLDTQMEFDLELAKEKSEKNPVYYVQYAYARIASILRKIPNSKSQITNPEAEPGVRNGAGKILSSKLEPLSHPSETALVKELIKFPEIVEDTAKDYQIQRLPHYAIKIADLFHRFYHDCRVLPAPYRVLSSSKDSGSGGDDKELTKARLSLVFAAKIVIKNTLDLMGVSAPEKM